jgi:hypothetical protein
MQLVREVNSLTSLYNIGGRWLTQSEEYMKKMKELETEQGQGRHKLGIKKVTLRDLDDHTLDAIAGGATNRTICACHTVLATNCHTC